MWEPQLLVLGFHLYEFVSLAWHSDSTEKTNPRRKIPGGQNGLRLLCSILPRQRSCLEHDGGEVGFHVHVCPGAPNVKVTQESRVKHVTHALQIPFFFFTQIFLVNG